MATTSRRRESCQEALRGGDGEGICREGVMEKEEGEEDASGTTTGAHGRGHVVFFVVTEEREMKLSII